MTYEYYAVGMKVYVRGAGHLTNAVKQLPETLNTWHSMVFIVCIVYTIYVDSGELISTAVSAKTKIAQ